MKRIFFFVFLLLLVTGCSSNLKVELKENVISEYGEIVEYSKLFNEETSDQGVEIKEVKNFDAKKVGKQVINVVFTDYDEVSEVEMTIEVKDTKKPVIVLHKNDIVITAGEKLDLQSNIKSVADPIDGPLTYQSDSIEKNGYYINKGKFNANKVGTYVIHVIAIDVNGNKAEMEFKVSVKKKGAEKKEETSNFKKNGSSNTSSKENNQSSNNGNSTTPSKKPSSNTGSSSSNKPSKPNRPNKPNKPNRPSYDPAWENPNGTCHHGHKKAYNGKWFNSGNEADDYAGKLCLEQGVCGAYGGWKCSNCGKWCITGFY